MPYMRIPVLKILAASQIVASRARTSRATEAEISRRPTLEPAEIRRGITSGDTGGTKERTLAKRPSGL